MDEKPKTWAVSLQDVVSVHVMTSLPIDVRFPDCDFLVRLEPPRRWKRGQKLNRGGRRRAKAKHAASLPGRPPHSVTITVNGESSDFALPDGMTWRRAEVDAKGNIIGPKSERKDGER